MAGRLPRRRWQKAPTRRPPRAAAWVRVLVDDTPPVPLADAPSSSSTAPPSLATPTGAASVALSPSSARAARVAPGDVVALSRGPRAPHVLLLLACIDASLPPGHMRVTSPVARAVGAAHGGRAAVRGVPLPLPTPAAIALRPDRADAGGGAAGDPPHPLLGVLVGAGMDGVARAVGGWLAAQGASGGALSDGRTPLADGSIVRLAPAGAPADAPPLDLVVKLVWSPGSGCSWGGAAAPADITSRRVTVSLDPSAPASLPPRPPPPHPPSGRPTNPPLCLAPPGPAGRAPPCAPRWRRVLSARAAAASAAARARRRARAAASW